MSEKIGDITQSLPISLSRLTHDERVSDQFEWAHPRPREKAGYSSWVPAIMEHEKSASYLWGRVAAPRQTLTYRVIEWSAECTTASDALFAACVTIDAEVRSGLPVLRDTRFTVAQTLAEIADSSGVDEVAKDFRLDANKIRDLLNSLSLQFDRSWADRR